MSEGTDNPAFEYALATTPAAETVPHDDERRLMGETVRGHTELLIGMGDAKTAWRFLLVNALEMGLITFEEFAEKMGGSRSTAYRILQKMGQRPP